MSFYFTIDVRIKDKRTGDVISGPKVLPAPVGMYSGYEEVCWWNSSMFLDLPPAVFRICGKYMEKQYPMEEGTEGCWFWNVTRSMVHLIFSILLIRKTFITRG